MARLGSSAPSPHHLVVVDDDQVLLKLLKVHLEREGYRITTFTTGAEALAFARRRVPDLFLTDSLLPDMNGLEVCRRLQEDSRTRHILLIVLSSVTDTPSATAAFDAGADDFVGKPVNFDELAARLRAHLRRATSRPAANPLTGLPGNLAIDQEIKRVVSPGRGPFAVLHLDLDNFKVYNDAYGFPAGDEAIGLLAEIVTEAAADLGNEDDFVGHVGGDDFVVVSTPDRAEAIASRIVAAFDQRVPDLYNPIDRQRRFITGRDRQGMIQKFPLMGVTIAIVHNEYRPVTTHWQVGEIGAEVKRFAKTRPGSKYVKDSRRT